MRTIGVISDTHGLLRDEAVAALAGSDLIVHAGDVGDDGILRRLEEIAPLRAVHGNTDHGPVLAALPATIVVDLTSPDGAPSAGGHGPLIYVLHELEHLDLDPRAAGFGAVVYGHTHVPTIDRKDQVLYFNPGAAGHRRFKLPVTVGRLRVAEDGSVEGEIVYLEVGE